MHVPEKIIVTCVLALITYLQVTTIFFIISPSLGGWTSSLAQKVLLPLHVSLISIYVNYFLAWQTDPGHVPQDWTPPVEVLNSDSLGGPRYCNKCECFKPPRSHHCKQCGKCILRMDHHCPWIGNCVGFGNYSHFVRFLFSVVICCTYGCYLLVLHWFNSSRYSTPKLIFVVINIASISLIIIIVGTLTAYHIYCLLTGQTTIEGSERRRTKILVRRRKIEFFDFPFDLGYYKNICSVLGNNPILWAWPDSSSGDGIRFATKHNTDPLMAYYWPPKAQADTIPEEGQRLVRRDSEGYLVKEITLQDRMEMLYDEVEPENEETLEIEYQDSGSDMTDYELEDNELLE